MTDRVNSKPDHGFPVGRTSSGDQVMATEPLQVFFDDLVLKTDALLGDQGPTLPSYTVATLPPVNTAGIIYVSNETGGAVIAFSDGTNWRRVTDRAIVS